MQTTDQQRPPLLLRDYGPDPLVVNIARFSHANPFFRTALWTGPHLQLTLMSIPVGSEIGLEMHPQLDQFIRIQNGTAQVRMGKTKTNLSLPQTVNSDYGIIIPAGTWHNIVNVGDMPLKLYSIYAPPQHPYGTVHQTKAEAEAQEH